MRFVHSVKSIKEHGNIFQEEISMAEIVLTRIDNRLIHGQVASVWCKSFDIDVLIVAHDATAQDEFRQSLMSMAVPSDVQTYFYSIQDTINACIQMCESKHIMIVCATPDDALKLVEGGLPIKLVNIGNMHMSVGKHQVATTVAVNDKDVECFKKMMELGVELEIQRIPCVEKESLKNLFRS